MSVKSLAHVVTRSVSKQILTAQKHSPVMLAAVGTVGVVTSAVLACRATLKMSDVLGEGEKELLELPVIGEEATKASMSVRLHTAIKIAKLYAPSVAVGLISLGAITGSHVILTRRNASLTAAYAIVHKGFEEYRGRVIADQGAEKDLEYRFGLIEREIVEEGPNGPETRFIKEVDHEAVRKASGQSTYAVVFDEWNPNWSAVHMQNQFYVQSIQAHFNDVLRLEGFVFLNDVYDYMGFAKTKAGQMVGWSRFPKKGQGDGYIDFGVAGNKLEGKKFVMGHYHSITLDFNVDGVVLDQLEEA